jgi:hypothetical protein
MWTGAGSATGAGEAAGAAARRRTRKAFVGMRPFTIP